MVFNNEFSSFRFEQGTRCDRLLSRDQVFLISLDPDPVSAPGSHSKKKCRRSSKSYSLEENLKFMTKDR